MHHFLPQSHRTRHVSCNTGTFHAPKSVNRNQHQVVPKEGKYLELVSSRVERHQRESKDQTVSRQNSINSKKMRTKWMNGPSRLLLLPKRE